MGDKTSQSVALPIATNAGFNARYNHQTVVFNNKMWVIGGYDGTFKNDVWSSSDGFFWDNKSKYFNFTFE